MSDKDNKKVRQLVRRSLKKEALDVSTSLQNLILKFGFRQRAVVAWKILCGKPFLAGTQPTSKGNDDA